MSFNVVHDMSACGNEKVLMLEDITGDRPGDSM